MLAVADAIDALDWMEAIGGLEATMRAGRRERSRRCRLGGPVGLGREPRRRPGGAVQHLGLPAHQVDPEVAALDDKGQQAFVKRMTAALEAEGAAFDIASYRDAPPGLRIWCGATVDTADVEALTPWLDWAFAGARTEGRLRRPSPLEGPRLSRFSPRGRSPDAPARAGRATHGDAQPCPRF
jgi:phosphoserine aminotransferase